MARSTLQVCTFRIGTLQMGLPIDPVREVLESGDPTPVPLAPTTVAGIMSLRGQIVTVIDTHRRFDIEPPNSPEGRNHIVIKYNEDRYSLLVDGIGDIVELPNSSLGSVPKTLDRPPRHLVDSVAEYEDDWLFVLDLPTVMQLDETPGSHERRR